MEKQNDINIDKKKRFNKEYFLHYGSPFKALIIYSIPAIIIMLTFSLSNLFDKIFAQIFAPENLINNSKIQEMWSQMTSSEMTLDDIRDYINVATQYSYVLFTLCSACVSLFTVGVTVIYSTEYGKKNYKNMNEIFSSSIIHNLIFSILIALILFFLTYPEFNALAIRVQEGKKYNPITTYLAWRYSMVLVFALPFYFLSYLIINILRCQGKIWTSITIIVTSLIFNCGLNYIFLYYAKMDLDGVMLATLLSWLYSIIFSYIIILFEKNNNIKIHWKDFKNIRWNFLKHSILIGTTASLIRASNAIFSLVNAALLTELHGSPYSETNHLFIFQQLISSLMPWMLVLVNVIIGFAQGARVVLSYSYGAKQFLRIKKLFKILIILILLWILLWFLIMIIWGSELLQIFSLPKDISEKYHSYVLLYVIGYPFFSITCSAIVLFTTIKMPYKGIFLSFMRSFGVLFILAFLGFLISNYIYDNVTTNEPGLFYFITIGLNDFIMAFITIPIIFYFWKKYKHKAYDHFKEIKE